LNTTTAAAAAAAADDDDDDDDDKGDGQYVAEVRLEALVHAE